MSVESEQKMQPPSIIARLMGFEGLSPLEPTHKYCPNTQVKSQLTNHENCSQIRTSKQQHQFKDVYEVSESTKVENQRYQSRRITTSDTSEAEMAFLRRRFIDAKRLATDETFQGSKEFNDALEVLQSNKDLFLKLLQEPESMLAKHPHDLRRANPSPERLPISKESLANQSCINKETRIKYRRHSSRNFESGISEKRSKMHGHSKKWLEVSDDRSTLPTKIVVLKPNFRRIQVSEPELDVLSCISEFESRKKVQNMRIRNAELWAKKRFNDGLQLPKQNTGESRDVAKRIAKQMRCSLHSGYPDFSLYGPQHFTGDGSSSYESENDSPYGLDYLSFRRYDTDRNKAVLSHNTGSSVNKEAKKRLSERWMMSQRFQEVGLSKRSTLGEMLSVPESGKESQIVILAGKDSNKGRTLYNSEEQAWPLGISSRDGWKYGRFKSLSKSTSVPASSDSRGIFESPMRHKISNEDRHLLQVMSLRDSKKSMKEIPRHNTGLNDRSRRSKNERLHSTRAQKNFSGDYLVSQMSDEIPHDKEIIVPETSVSDAVLIINEVHDAQQYISAMSLIPLEKYDHGRSVFQSEIHSPQHDLRIFNTQNISFKIFGDNATHTNLLSVSPESPSRSKNAEQPSPMSVLGVPFVDDLSSGTECFESLTADLQGLRMQLQLLKQESESYAEGSIAISSSEDDHESFGVSEKRSLVAVDSLDSSYIVDALTNFGFYDTDPYTLMATWHSPDCPVCPVEFEKLEEKYGEQALWSRSERRILFDLLNSGLVEILKPFRDPQPWVKQSFFLSVSSENRDIDGLEEKLLNWLQVQITQESDGTAAEKAAGKGLEWYNAAHCIDQVCSGVEDLLTDELIAEVLDIW